jgi:hypothetical protein
VSDSQLGVAVIQAAKLLEDAGAEEFIIGTKKGIEFESHGDISLSTYLNIHANVIKKMAGK